MDTQCEYVFSSRFSVIDQDTISSTEQYPANLAMLIGKF